MRIKAQLLKLHFSQLILSWSKSKLNRYSDKNKQDFHAKLHTLIHGIKQENFDSLSDTDLEKRKSVIDFIFTCLEFLDKSTINSFPLEIVECLNVALNEWSDSDDCLIATSLNNNIHSFSFLPSPSLDNPLFAIIKNEYGVDFDKRLIQINLPKFFARDYFANVALYHELGHFIDTKYRISSCIYLVLLDTLSSLNTNQLAVIIRYFPYLTPSSITETQKIQLFNHLGEYFSDVFAAQYIGECSNRYVQYISNSGDFTCPTHPSTNNRIQLVHDFINHQENYLLQLISLATSAVTRGKDLKIRYKELPLDDFNNLLPMEIHDKNDLSSLFIAAWKLWMEYSTEFESENNMMFKLLDSKKYEIINNLVEKSISNYTTTQKWEKTAGNDNIEELH